MDPTIPQPVRPVAKPEEEAHQEKRPVLKIVKDKVKKIKDTINKKGHNGHGDEGNDEEDDEFVEDHPEVHGAPMYESLTSKDRRGGEEAIGGERASAGNGLRMGEFEAAPKKEQSPVHESRTTKEFGEDAAGVGNGLKMGEFAAEPKKEQSPVYESLSAMEKPEEGAATSEKVGIGRSLEKGEFIEDPAALKTEHNSAGGVEQAVDMTPELNRSLDAMTISSQNENRVESKQQPSDEGMASYTDTLSSAASKVYEKVSEAGTAVYSKMKPDDAKRNGGDQPAERAAGSGGVVGKIREAVTSFIGAGPGSREPPPVTESDMKGNN